MSTNEVVTRQAGGGGEVAVPDDTRSMTKPSLKHEPQTSLHETSLFHSQHKTCDIIVQRTLKNKARRKMSTQNAPGIEFAIVPEGSRQHFRLLELPPDLLSVITSENPPV